MARKIGKAYSLSKEQGDGCSTGMLCTPRFPSYANASCVQGNWAYVGARGEVYSGEYDGEEDGEQDWGDEFDEEFTSAPRHGYDDWGERDEFGRFQGKARNSRLVTVEAKEHMHLLALYYAAYDDMNTPSAATEDAYIRALERCNDFYAGDAAW